MIIYVDIDDTICFYHDKNTPINYELALPNFDRISKINQLFENGNYIVYWTARGTKTGIDWSSLTTKQLDNWGCKYNELKFGKPVYDLFIDDKNINSESYFANVVYQ